MWRSTARIHVQIPNTRTFAPLCPRIHPEAAREALTSGGGRPRMTTTLRRPPHILLSLPCTAGRLPSPPRLRTQQLTGPRRPLADTSNRSMLTRTCQAPAWPPAAGSCAARLAPAHMPTAQPAGAPTAPVRRYSSRLQTEVGTGRSSRTSMKSTKLRSTSSRPPSAPTSARYPSTIGTMLQSSFRARLDAQPSTCRSVACARHRTSR